MSLAQSTHRTVHTQLCWILWGGSMALGVQKILGLQEAWKKQCSWLLLRLPHGGRDSPQGFTAALAPAERSVSAPQAQDELVSHVGIPRCGLSGECSNPHPDPAQGHFPGRDLIKEPNSVVPVYSPSLCASCSNKKRGLPWEVGEGACHQARPPQFDLWNLRGRRGEKNIKSYPLDCCYYYPTTHRLFK